MAITVNWITKVITIPQADLTPIVGTLYELDTDWFRLQLKAIEQSEAGMVYPDTHRHNTEVTVAGVTYARTIEIINGYSITFEDGQYSVRLSGSNNNIFDIQNGILNQNQVQVIPTNSAGYIVIPVGSGLDATQDAKLMSLPDLSTIEASAIIAKEEKQDAIISLLEGLRYGRWFVVRGNPQNFSGREDFFHGVNGDALTNDLWEVESYTLGTGPIPPLPTIQNNRAEWSGSDDAASGGGFEFRDCPSGDFEWVIECGIKVEECDLPDPSDPYGHQIYIAFFYTDAPNFIDFDFFEMGLRYSPDGNVYVYADSMMTSEEVITTDEKVKIKFSRQGDTFTIFHWNWTLERWEWNGDTDGLELVGMLDPSTFSYFDEVFLDMGAGIANKVGSFFVDSIYYESFTDFVPSFSYGPAITPYGPWADGDFALDSLTGDGYILDGDVWYPMPFVNEEYKSFIKAIYNNGGKWFSIPHDPRTLTGYEDFFFGNNGDLINDTIWNQIEASFPPTKYSLGHDYPYVIKNNKMYCECSVENPDDYTESVVFNKEVPIGDFELTFDFALEISDQAVVDFFYEFENYTTTLHYFGVIIWTYEGGGEIYYDIFEEPGTKEFTTQNLEYSKVKIKREGGVITTWLWHDVRQQWEWNGDVNGITTDYDYTDKQFDTAYFLTDLYTDVGAGKASFEVNNFIMTPVNPNEDHTMLPVWKSGDFVLNTLTGEKFYLDGNVWVPFGDLSIEQESQLEDIHNVETGNWEITNNQMIFRTADGLTEILRVNLFDNIGPAETNVIRREVV